MLGASFLARQNNSFCHFLNRVINGCFISHECFIPKTINLPHGKVVIGDRVNLGENVTIYQNTTLGSISNENDNYPVIGDDVTIGANCVILGKVKIKKGKLVKAKSFIYKK